MLHDWHKTETYRDETAWTAHFALGLMRFVGKKDARFHFPDPTMGSKSSTLPGEPWRVMPTIEETQDFVGTRDFEDVKHLRILLVSENPVSSTLSAVLYKGKYPPWC